MKDELITIATDHYTAAEVLKAHLESAGIECVLKNINLLQGAVSEGVQIQIKSRDLEKALRLMNEWKIAYEKEERKNISSLRRILVPVDFSEYSKNACIYALNLAKKYNTDIKILHVYYAPIVDLVPITDAYSIQVDMDINLRELEINAKKSLLEFVKEIREYAQENGFEKIKIAYSLKEGIIEDQIIQTASDYKPGIIVIGTKGKGEKQSDIIGSVAYRVISRSGIPVLAIPEKSYYDVKKEKEIKSIAYVTDFDNADFLAIRRLMNIISAFNVELHCLHISKDALNTLDSVKMDSLKDYFKKINPKIKVECHMVSEDDKLKAIEDFYKKENINLIAIANKRRGLLSRLFSTDLTKKIIQESNIPLMSFKA
ncbi:MAG: universal stress protein [Bacteroidales bacterium]